MGRNMIKLSVKILITTGLLASQSAFGQESCDDYECKLNQLATTCQTKTDTSEDAHNCFNELYENQVCGAAGSASVGCMLAAAGLSGDLRSNRFNAKIDTGWKKPIGDLQFESFAIQKIGHTDDKSSSHQLTLVCNDSSVMIGYQTVNSETFFASKENIMTEDSTVTAAFDSGASANIQWRPTGKDTLILLSPDNARTFVSQLKASETFVITTNTNSGSNSVNFETANFEEAYTGINECS